MDTRASDYMYLEILEAKDCAERAFDEARLRANEFEGYLSANEVASEIYHAAQSMLDLVVKIADEETVERLFAEAKRGG